MNKKAALELSVNAIVILIMAIAVLGLALGFIRSQLNKIDFDVQAPDPETPTAQIPITYSLEKGTISPGGSLEMKIKIFNGGQNTVSVQPNINCPTNNPISGTIQKGSPQNIQPQSFKMFLLVAPISSSASGSYVCTITASNLADISADVSFEVK
ncbi:MAG: hypothetical protein QXG00_05485 [Candidatus Woesearchaeota archaeon]